MQCLVVFNLALADHAPRLEEILRTIVAAVYAQTPAEIRVLGTYRRAGRGRANDELVHAVEVSFAKPPPRSEAGEPVAQHLENMLRSMIAASAFAGCEARAYGSD